VALLEELQKVSQGDGEEGGQTGENSKRNMTRQSFVAWKVHSLVNIVTYAGHYGHL
jgi:hypothetical protein